MQANDPIERFNISPSLVRSNEFITVGFMNLSVGKNNVCSTIILVNFRADSVITASVSIKITFKNEWIAPCTEIKHTFFTD